MLSGTMRTLVLTGFFVVSLFFSLPNSHFAYTCRFYTHANTDVQISAGYGQNMIGRINISLFLISKEEGGQRLKGRSRTHSTDSITSY